MPRTENPFAVMQREFDSMFDRFFGDRPWAETWDMKRSWGIEWTETEKELVLRAELPGFELSEIDVRVAGDVLTITAEHKVPDGETTEERRVTEVRRSFTLPSGLETEKVEAVYCNGVLEVHLPRSPEVQPRRIEVKALCYARRLSGLPPARCRRAVLFH
jgi:HSP20 family protein